MQTIRITITSEQPTNVEITEKRFEGDKLKSKKSPHKKLEALLCMMTKQEAQTQGLKRPAQT